MEQNIMEVMKEMERKAKAYDELKNEYERIKSIITQAITDFNLKINNLPFVRLNSAETVHHRRPRTASSELAREIIDFLSKEKGPVRGTIIAAKLDRPFANLSQALYKLVDLKILDKLKIERQGVCYEYNPRITEATPENYKKIIQEKMNLPKLGEIRVVEERRNNEEDYFTGN